LSARVKRGEYLGKRGKTVGGATGVANDFVFRLVGIKIDSAHKHGCIGRGSRDDDLLGSSLKMGRCLVNRGENTRRLDDVLSLAQFKNGSYISTALSPWNVCGVTFTIDINLVSVDDQFAAFGVDITLESSMCGIILEHVHPIISPFRNDSYMYSRSMKGSLMAVISTFLFFNAFRKTCHEISKDNKKK
jgi:hypothetical protein